ncbi:MAG: Lrp/AsnC family transcriptional regulator, partial [Candidatus Thermoplasmatota archaeon]
KLGFSRQKAWRIIKRLEKTKEIWGYTTIVDQEKSDWETFLLLIKSKSPHSDFIKKVLNQVKKSEEAEVDIIDVFFLHGSFDWFVMFSGENIKKAQRFMGFLEKNYGDYLLNIKLHENIFPLMKGGKLNPNVDEINEFSVNT